MIVIDTNIIAPLYVQSVQTEAVTKLFAQDQIWRTEPLALIELSNVLISYERSRYITAATRATALTRAAFSAEPVSVSHRAALDAHFVTARRRTDARFSPSRNS